MMIMEAPNAEILPITIDGCWEIFKNNGYPVPWGKHIWFTVHEPISTFGRDPNELIDHVQGIIEGAKRSANTSTE
jgi:hypothetical protein